MFNPAPQIGFGPRYRFGDRWGLGLIVTYRWTPHYPDARLDTDMHSVTASASLFVLLGNGVVMSFPLALGHNFTADTSTLGFGVKFVIPLARF